MTSATEQRKTSERLKLTFAGFTASLIVLGWNASWFSGSLDRLKEVTR